MGLAKKCLMKKFYTSNSGIATLFVITLLQTFSNEMIIPVSIDKKKYITRDSFYQLSFIQMNFQNYVLPSLLLWSPIKEGAFEMEQCIKNRQHS